MIRNIIATEKAPAAIGPYAQANAVGRIHLYFRSDSYRSGYGKVGRRRN